MRKQGHLCPEGFRGKGKGAHGENKKPRRNKKPCLADALMKSWENPCTHRRRDRAIKLLPK